MITFYTAVGRYILRDDDQGNRYPVVITHGNENILNVPEMHIWSSLLWRVSTYDELKQEYLAKTGSSQVSGQYDLDHYLNRLQQRGLVASGRDYVAIDAVYNLLSRLYVIPQTDSLFVKLCAFIDMSFRGVPLYITKNIFRRTQMSECERRVLHIARQQMMSTAELIQCVQLGVTDVRTDNTLLEALYSDEDTSSDNIHISSRFAAAQQPVLQAVANLYLKKQVLFEKAF